MARNRRSLLVLLLALPLVLAPGAGSAEETEGLELTEFRIDQDALCDLREEWADNMLATHEQGTWAPLKFELTDSQLARMGLPPADVLRSRDYSVPTMVSADGQFQEIALSDLEAAMDPAVVSYAGTGCLGIRPGADRKSTRLNSSHSQISYAVF